MIMYRVFRIVCVLCVVCVRVRVCVLSRKRLQIWASPTMFPAPCLPVDSSFRLPSALFQLLLLSPGRKLGQKKKPFCRITPLRRKGQKKKNTHAHAHAREQTKGGEVHHPCLPIR